MGIQFPLSLISSILLFFFLVKLMKAWKKPTHKLPPGPWNLPLIGSMHHIAAGLVLPHHAFRDLAQKYGPLMHLRLGQVSTIVVSSPTMAKQVMKTLEHAFVDRPSVISSYILFYNGQDVAFAPCTGYHRQMRRICSMELLSPKTVRSFSSTREEGVWRLVESIRTSLGSPVNLSQRLRELMFASVCRAVVGKSCKDQAELMDVLKEEIDMAGGFSLEDLFPWVNYLPGLGGVLKHKLEELHHRVDRILDNIVDEHREINQLACSMRGGNNKSREEDLVDVLLRHQKSGDLEFPIKDANIKATIHDLLLGGTDSSATTVAWALSEMIKNPRVMEKAQAEVKQALNGKKTVHEADINQLGLSYLQMVIKETLRLHPPGPLLLPRECKEQCEIDGYTIPAKTRVAINAWAIGRDPEYWHDPESFIPERFENSSINFTGNNFQLIPFGAGRRICPGISFAMASIQLPLALLLYHFKWKLPSDEIKPEELDMTEKYGLTLVRKKDLCLIPTSFFPPLVDA